MRPEVVGSSPATARSSVDLPQPDGPSTASTSPSATSTVASTTAGTPSYATETSLDRQHQNAPTDGTRSRSTASITSAVVAARTTDAASAMP